LRIHTCHPYLHRMRIHTSRPISSKIENSCFSAHTFKNWEFIPVCPYLQGLRIHSH
jgi:hypothetical protein